MLLSRRLDDKEIQLKRQNKIFFQISGAGHEARPGGRSRRSSGPAYDWFYPYYRDRALCLALGDDRPRDAALGRRRDRRSRLRRPADAVALGAQGAQHRRNRRVPPAPSACRPWGWPRRSVRRPRLHERTARSHRATRSSTFRRRRHHERRRVLGIAQHRLQPEAAGPVSDRGQRLRDLGAGRGQDAGGVDLAARPIVSRPARARRSTAATRSRPTTLREAVAYARQREGPALVHAHVIRPYSHSLSDDEVLYRPAAERERGGGARSGRTFPARCSPTAWPPRPNSTRSRPRSPTRSTTRPRPRWPRRSPRRTRLPLRLLAGRRSDLRAVRHRGRSAVQGEPTTMVDLLNACLQRRDGARSPHRHLRRGRGRCIARGALFGEVKGKGGVFKVTHGLQRDSAATASSTRRWPRPTSSAAPSAWPTRGLKPVVEIQFFDYIWPAYMQLRNELATMRWRSNNAFMRSRWSCASPTAGTSRAGPSITRSPARASSPHARPARGLPGDRARRQRAAADRDPLRRPGALPRAQAPLPPDLQQGAQSRAPTS